MDDRTLEKILSELGIEKWDLLIVGDGSGSNWHRSCGWGAIAVDHETLARKVFYGSMNLGTVNLAELFPYLQVLSWYQALLEQRRKRHKVSKGTKEVHILTDSAYVARLGSNIRNSANLSRNAAVWLALSGLRRQGLILHWHHTKRESLGLNAFADSISKLARKHITCLEARESAEDIAGRTVYEINPSRE